MFVALNNANSKNFEQKQMSDFIFQMIILFSTTLEDVTTMTIQFNVIKLFL